MPVNQLMIVAKHQRFRQRQQCAPSTLQPKGSGAKCEEASMLMVGYGPIDKTILAHQVGDREETIERSMPHTFEDCDTTTG